MLSVLVAAADEKTDLIGCCHRRDNTIHTVNIIFFLLLFDILDGGGGIGVMAVEARGIWWGLGVLAGELLHQSPKLGGAGLDLHGVGYVDYLHWVG